MRVLLGIAVAAVLVFTAWSANPTEGKAYSTISVDPFGITTTTTRALPEEQYDQGTIF